MRVMVIVKASEDSEAGVLPGRELLGAMGAFNEELVKAGVMLAGEGLQATAKGVRLHFSGTQRELVSGPFTPAAEQIAGFWLWQVESMQAAIDWVRRCPNPHAKNSVIEIRPLFEAADFGKDFTPELQTQEERIRAKAAQLQGRR